MIESYLPDGSWLSMVDFDSNAVLLSPFVQIDSFTTRQNLVAKLPRVGSGGTCIPCGLQLALAVRYSLRYKLFIARQAKSNVIPVSKYAAINVCAC